MKTQLSNDQIIYIEALFEKFSKFNEIQILYNNILTEEIIVTKANISKIILNADFNQFIDKDPSSIPEDIVESYLNQQEYLSNFTKHLSTLPPADLGIGLGATAATTTNTDSSVAEKKEDKEEEKKVVIIYHNFNNF